MIRFPLARRNLSEGDHLILKVLKLYYGHRLTQNEVARRMGFSRPKVSKLISEGRARGLVKIEIAEPGEDFAALEIAVEDRRGLAEAVVVASAESRGATELAVGAATAEVLGRICTRSTGLGVSWGRSSRALADALAPQAFAAGKVVPLVGGMGRAATALHSNQVAATLSGKLSAESLYLSAPAVAPSARSREELMRSPGIEEVLAEGSARDLAVVGIGGILSSSTLVGAGYFSREEFLGLKDRGIVGDVCFHFLDSEGRPGLPGFSGRVIGVTLDRLREIPKVVGLATGAEKARGVAAAIKAGCVSTLVCDRELAGALLEIEDRRSCLLQDDGNRVELLRQMLPSRHFDEKANDLYAEGKVPGTTHLYVGRESVAANAIAAPKEGDRSLIRAEGEDTEAALVGLISTEKE